MLATNYFHKLKTLADALCDVGQPISDKGQVINMLRGLNSKFTTGTLIPNLTPFPTFLRTRSLLRLEEVKMKNDPNTATAIALLVAENNSFGGSSSSGDRDNFSSGRAQSFSLGPGPWLCFNPWSSQPPI